MAELDGSWTKVLYSDRQLKGSRLGQWVIDSLKDTIAPMVAKSFKKKISLDIFWIEWYHFFLLGDKHVVLLGVNWPRRGCKFGCFQIKNDWIIANTSYREQLNYWMTLRPRHAHFSQPWVDQQAGLSCWGLKANKHIVEKISSKFSSDTLRQNFHSPFLF